MGELEFGFHLTLELIHLFYFYCYCYYYGVLNHTWQGSGLFFWLCGERSHLVKLGVQLKQCTLCGRQTSYPCTISGPSMHFVEYLDNYFREEESEQYVYCGHLYFASAYFL